MDDSDESLRRRVQNERFESSESCVSSQSGSRTWSTHTSTIAPIACLQLDWCSLHSEREDD